MKLAMHLTCGEISLRSYLIIDLKTLAKALYFEISVRAASRWTEAILHDKTFYGFGEEAEGKVRFDLSVISLLEYKSHRKV